MDMESALRARLLAAAPVTALVGQRVAWVERPQADALPGITLQLVTDERATNTEDFDGAQAAFVQLDIWAATYSQAKQIKEAVIAALAPDATQGGVHFTRTFFSARDLSEKTDTVLVFRPSIDLNFFYFPTA